MIRYEPVWVAFEIEVVRDWFRRLGYGLIAGLVAGSIPFAVLGWFPAALYLVTLAILLRLTIASG